MTTLYLLFAIALIAVLYLTHENDKLRQAVKTLRAVKTKRPHVDPTATYISWQWPPAYAGRTEDVTERNIAMTQFDYDSQHDPVTSEHDWVEDAHTLSAGDVLDPNRCDTCGAATNDHPFRCDNCPADDPGTDIFDGRATGFGTPAQRARWAADRAIANRIDCCQGCGTQDTGRWGEYHDEAYCDDCINTQIEEHAERDDQTWQMIVTEQRRRLEQGKSFVPSEYWICRQPGCGTLLRFGDPDRGKFKCEQHEHGHWVLKAPGPYSQLSINQGWGWNISNPHMGLIAIPRFGSRDEILPSELRQVEPEEAIRLYEEEQQSYRDDEDGERSCFDRTYDAHAAYIPPLHGPCDATWVPITQVEVANAIAGLDDDIPF